jgi:hypothetical protein
MTTQVNINRQTVLLADIDIDRADFGVLAANVEKTVQFGIHLPAGARMIGGWLDTIVAANTAGASTATFTIDVGDTAGSDDTDRYTASPIDVKTTGIDALTVPGDAKIPTGGAWITLTALENPTGVGAATATAGQWKLMIQYMVEDRVSEYNAYRG